MDREADVLFWRRIDVAGLERLTLTRSAEAVSAESTLLCAEDGGVRIDHRWWLSPDWRVLSAEVEKWGPDGHTLLTIERADGGWKVNGARRGDLDGVEEADLSVTPFCNSFPIRQMTAGDLESLTLETCSIDAATMTVARSCQRYDRLGPDLLRYVDLGQQAGFEAEIRVDDRGLVTRYQDLFERVIPG